METITCSDARANLAKTMDRVCDDHAPVIITRKNAGTVVMLLLQDYEGLHETASLLRSPANARRLPESVGGIEAGGAKGETR